MADAAGYVWADHVVGQEPSLTLRRCDDRSISFNEPVLQAEDSPHYECPYDLAYTCMLDLMEDRPARGAKPVGRARGADRLDRRVYWQAARRALGSWPPMSATYVVFRGEPPDDEDLDEVWESFDALDVDRVAALLRELLPDARMAASELDLDLTGLSASVVWEPEPDGALRQVVAHLNGSDSLRSRPTWPACSTSSYGWPTRSTAWPGRPSASVPSSAPTYKPRSTDAHRRTDSKPT